MTSLCVKIGLPTMENISLPDSDPCSNLVERHLETFKARMQGKSCFSFTTVDAALVVKREDLTGAT